MGKKSSQKHTKTIYYYALKYHRLLDDGFSCLHGFSKSKCRSVLEALANLAKYLNCYSRFKQLKNEAGVKWSSENGFEIFKRLYITNRGDGLHEWFKQIKALPYDYIFPILFQSLTGLRPSEAIASLNNIAENGGLKLL